MRPPAQTGKPRATASDRRGGSQSLGAEPGLGTTDLPGAGAVTFDAALPSTSKPDDDRRLIDELRRWCQWHPRFGSERVHQLLLGTGWRVNFKRVHRLWKQEHLQVPGNNENGGVYREKARTVAFVTRLYTATTSGATTSSWIGLRMVGS